MNRKDYGEFMSMKDIKKEFAIKNTTTMMRVVHKQQIPYKKLSKKLILFVTDAVYSVLTEMKRQAGIYIVHGAAKPVGRYRR